MLKILKTEDPKNPCRLESSNACQQPKHLNNPNFFWLFEKSWSYEFLVSEVIACEQKILKTEGVNRFWTFEFMDIFFKFFFELLEKCYYFLTIYNYSFWDLARFWTFQSMNFLFKYFLNFLKSLNFNQLLFGFSANMTVSYIMR